MRNKVKLQNIILNERDARMERLKENRNNDVSSSVHHFYETKKTYTFDQKQTLKNFGKSSIAHLQARNFKILSEGLETPLDDSL